MERPSLEIIIGTTGAVATAAGAALFLSGLGERQIPDSVTSDPRYVSGRELWVALDSLEGSSGKDGLQDAVRNALRQATLAKSSAEAITQPTDETVANEIKAIETSLDQSASQLLSARIQTDEVIKKIKEDQNLKFYQENVVDRPVTRLYLGLMTTLIGGGSALYGFGTATVIAIGDRLKRRRNAQSSTASSI